MQAAHSTNVRNRATVSAPNAVHLAIDRIASHTTATALKVAHDINAFLRINRPSSTSVNRADFPPSGTHSLRISLAVVILLTTGTHGVGGTRSTAGRSSGTSRSRRAGTIASLFARSQRAGLC